MFLKMCYVQVIVSLPVKPVYICDRYETRSYENSLTPKHSGNASLVHATNATPDGNVQRVSSPEKLLSSISKVERAYNDIQGMLDEAGDSTRKGSPNLRLVAMKPLTPEVSTGTGQTYSTVTANNYAESVVNNFASSGGDESTTLEQRMLKQHTSQRTVEKRTVTMTTHSQLKSYRLNES
jgi:hypothetical protein